MMKSINRIWSKQGEIIAEGTFAVALTLAAMTMRYVTYFL